MSRALALLLAFWPVWKWYLARVTDGSDEPWGVLALLTAALYVVLRLQRTAMSSSVEVPPTALAVLAIYAIGFNWLPALARAVLALLCLALVFSPYVSRRRIHFGLMGLLLLSLPVIASLQFYAGYPLRALTGKIVSFFIGLTGEHVSAIGTSLLWRGDILSIDAPCSGIKMLWGGLYVAFALSCFAGLSNSQTWLCYLFSSFSIFMANILRTFVLFFTESRILEAPPWFHPLAGIAFFALALAAIMTFISHIHSRYHIICKPGYSR